VVLDEDVASGQHAKLVLRNGQWFIEDLNSTNGTYLDDTEVTSPMRVPVGARVRIGKTVLELQR
jgi:pSer/pThr/pTyr-binding forkhead associated (FHA) protein